jgi:hypothetical protein
MRACLLGLVVLCPALGCGESEGDGRGAGGTGGSAGQSSGAAGAASAGKGGVNAGGSGAGAQHGGQSGSASGGSAASSNAAGTTTGGSKPGEAGAPSGGGASGLSECNPKQVTCKIVQPQCPANQVPSVDGTCWGECVKIDQCACQSADDCPDQNQYTCWSQQHCGPFVK